MIWGIDISDYQPDFDLHRARREGYDFAIIKSTEGSTWRGKWFRTHLDRARSAGMLVAAYHYVRAGDVPGQVRNIQAMVPRDCPLILDVEDGAGPLSVTWDLTNRLRALGYKLPLTYIPKWYADKIGATNLRGLPPLWYSRYPNSRAGGAIDVWNRNAGWLNTMWGGYYGLHVEILQFSDQGSLAGRRPVDLNAYRGTREQLAALFGGAAPAAPGGIESMALDTVWEDSYGNKQNVHGFMRETQRDLNEVRNLVGQLTGFLFAPGSEKSRIPGDKNRTNGRDAIMDSTAWANITMREVAALRALVASQQGVDPNAVAEALKPLIAAEIAPVVREVLGEDNAAQADAIVDELTARLSRNETE